MVCILICCPFFITIIISSVEGGHVHNDDDSEHWAPEH